MGALDNAARFASFIFVGTVCGQAKQAGLVIISF